MLPRLLAPLIQDRLGDYPALALVGPRQCGKTTLARTLGDRYYDLEQDSDQLRLDLQWEEVIKGKSLVILDEAQSWPEVFPRLRGAIDDKRRQMGRFLLLGSISPALMHRVSESLAGRLALLELTPLLAAELTTNAARNRHWLMGGYPDGGVLEPKRYLKWQKDYLALLVQRDLPAWGLPAKPKVTDRLIRMLAALHGQQWNASQIGQSMGLSSHTINSYLDYLVEAFLIRRLPAWQANMRKRLVKSPKVYWRDSGLLHALLGVGDDPALLNQPWVGASWEGYVIEQILGTLAARGQQVGAYHFRTSDQHEIDLVLDFGVELWAVEIKLTTAPSPAAMAKLDKVAAMVGAARRFLISKTPQRIDGGDRVSCDLTSFLGYLPG